MYKTARIVAALALMPFLVSIPARALSVGSPGTELEFAL